MGKNCFFAASILVLLILCAAFHRQTAAYAGQEGLPQAGFEKSPSASLAYDAKGPTIQAGGTIGAHSIAICPRCPRVPTHRPQIASWAKAGTRSAPRLRNCWVRSGPGRCWAWKVPTMWRSGVSKSPTVRGVWTAIPIRISPAKGTIHLTAIKPTAESGHRTRRMSCLWI